MWGAFTIWWHGILRWLSRAEWAVRLLGLPRETQAADEPGLVLIQIDGLSRTQFEQALARGRFPFLKRRLERHHHRLHTFYSGLPSSTPAVQAELFYGEKTAVPAFCFRFHDTGELARMYYAEPASKVESRLQTAGTPLLLNGSAYVDIYVGGAAEAHYCSPVVGWGTLAHMVNPLAWLALALGHGVSLLRVAALMVVEFVLALFDFARGILAGRDLMKELSLVPGRVLVGIGLREAATIGAAMDMARGLPVIHLNLLAYDEQAHCRGPASAFAHWSLRGIDHAIARICRAAASATAREYEVWVYSDHGQLACAPYAKVHGRTIHDAVAEVFEQPTQAVPLTEPPHGERSSRAAWLGGKRLGRFLSGFNGAAEVAAPVVGVAAMGPVGHVYPPRELHDHERADYAERLLRQAQVPLVLWLDANSQVHALNAHGRFLLPDDAAAVLGEQHPFLREAALDLCELVRHRDAGTLVISGYDVGGRHVSFAIELGTHAGPSPDETRAFALLPEDCPLPPGGPEYIRPLDLRKAALHYLGREPLLVPAAPPRIRRGTLRLATFHVHGCVGLDARLSPHRVARVIAHAQADVVLLQGLDLNSRSVRGESQPDQIVRALDHELRGQGLWNVITLPGGHAVLSRVPLTNAQSVSPLLDHVRPSDVETWTETPPGLCVEIEVAGRKVTLINPWLGRAKATRGVCVPQWLASLDRLERVAARVVVCGDLLLQPGSPEYALWRAQWLDTADVRPQPATNIPSRLRSRKQCRLFVSPGLAVLRYETPTHDLAKFASPHALLLVELRVA